MPDTLTVVDVDLAVPMTMLPAALAHLSPPA